MRKRNEQEIGSAATILERHSVSTVREWLTRVKKSKDLAHLKLSDQARTRHLRMLFNELVQRLRKPHLDEGEAKPSQAAIGWKCTQSTGLDCGDAALVALRVQFEAHVLLYLQALLKSR
jgi:hypothetical protein